MTKILRAGGGVAHRFLQPGRVMQRAAPRVREPPRRAIRENLFLSYRKRPRSFRQFHGTAEIEMADTTIEWTDATWNPVSAAAFSRPRVDAG